jgi:hypothetical protein
MTPSSSAKSLFLVTTPTDRAIATAEGSTIWQSTMKSWGDQVDELVEASSYADALALLDVIDQVVLPDKVSIIYNAGKMFLTLTEFICRKLDALEFVPSMQYLFSSLENLMPLSILSLN